MDDFNNIYSCMLHNEYGLATGFNPISHANRKVQAAIAFNVGGDRYLENFRFEKCSAVFNEIPHGATANQVFDEIISAAGKYGLKLYMGKFHITYENYRGKPVSGGVSYDAISLRDKCGFSIDLLTDWGHLDESGARPAIKVLFFKVRRDIQGSFYKAHQFLNGKIKRIFLDELGYKFLYGSARYSTNSEIRYKYQINGRDFDWRLEPQFIGYDCKLRPIVVSGLMLFYLRMGFTPVKFGVKRLSQFLSSCFSDDSVVMFGDEAKQVVVDEIGEDLFREYNSQSRENIHWWRGIQKERELQVPKEMRAAIVQDALDKGRMAF